MARNKAAERNRLFNLYSQQLEKGGVTPIDIFVCPLCRDGFTRDALDGDSKLVSLAHVIPEALGGREWTLSCTRCNNDNGAKLESELTHKFKFEDWSRGIGMWDARLSGEFGDIGVAFKRSPDTSNWKMYFVQKQTNPKCLVSFSEWMKKNSAEKKSGLSFNISWTAHQRPEQVAAAIHQSAYLLMFSYFGYDFAFREQYESLRAQILNPHQNIWKGQIKYLEAATMNKHFGDRDSAVLFIKHPQSVAVLMRFRPGDGQDRVMGILLPSPDAEPDFVPTLEHTSIQGSVVEYSPEVLSTRPRYFQKLWQQFISRES